jgi:hypothetical protein
VKDTRCPRCGNTGRPFRHVTAAGGPPWSCNTLGCGTYVPKPDPNYHFNCFECRRVHAEPVHYYEAVDVDRWKKLPT